jgi:glucose/arabinose dehydrogenase
LLRTNDRRGDLLTSPPGRGARGEGALLILIPIAILALVLTSCGGNDDPEPTPIRTTPAPTSPAPSATTPATLDPTAEDGPGTPAAFEIAFPSLPQLERPTVMVELPGQEQMLLAEQGGRVVTFPKDPSASTVTVALDWTERTSRSGNEEGFLGLALDPEFEDNGHVFIHYSARPGDRRGQISRLNSSGTGTDVRIDRASELPILTVPQPYSNHNGGQLAFGPDGMLYIGLGDGGSGGDPNGYGQDLTANLLGSILRVDVRGASTQNPYSIPSDNPFAGPNRTERGETWAYGLRNPWRFSFDRETGLLVAADVGQNEWEEIDIIEKGGNYGWNIMEGPDCFEPREGCSQEGLTLPIAWYGRDAGCSVTGGYVYRGEAVPALTGAYLYADFCNGTVWSIPRINSDDRGDPIVLLESGPQIASFAQDLTGELYLLSFDGRIYGIR